MNIFIKNILINYNFFIYILIFLLNLLESLFIIGLFLPSSIINFLLGYLIGKKYLNFYLVLLNCFLGNLLGDIISYYLGIYFNKKWLFFKKKLINYNYLFKLFFLYIKKYTLMVLFISKFINILRIFIFFICGTLYIPILNIIFLDLIIILIWLLLHIIPGFISSLLFNYYFNYNFYIVIINLIFLIILNIYISYKWYVLNFLNIKNIHFINIKYFNILFIFFLLLLINNLFLFIKNDCTYILLKIMYILFINNY